MAHKHKKSSPIFRSLVGLFSYDMRITAAWILIAGSVENFLRNINAPEEIVQFIVQQEDEKLQSILANEVRKNPQITIDNLQNVVQKYTSRRRFEVTPFEAQIAQEFSTRFYDVQNFGKWIILQLRRLRRNPAPNDSPTGPFEYDRTHVPSVKVLQTRLELIGEWAVINGIQIESYTFERAVEESEKWRKIIEEEQEGAEEEEWRKYPKFEENIVLYRYRNGWTMQVVRSKKDLSLEGNLMGHCVGGYCQKVESGDVIILSLRDKRNRPHVTMELRGPEDREAASDLRTAKDYNSYFYNEGLHFIQIQGKEDSPPIPEYKKMVGEWIKNTIKDKNPYSAVTFRHLFVEDEDVDRDTALARGKNNNLGLFFSMTHPPFGESESYIRKFIKEKTQTPLYDEYGIGDESCLDWKNPSKECQRMLEAFFLKYNTRFYPRQDLQHILVTHFEQNVYIAATKQISKEGTIDPDNWNFREKLEKDVDAIVDFCYLNDLYTIDKEVLQAWLKNKNAEEIKKQLEPIYFDISRTSPHAPSVSPPKKTLSYLVQYARYKYEFKIFEIENIKDVDLEKIIQDFHPEKIKGGIRKETNDKNYIIRTILYGYSLLHDKALKKLEVIREKIDEKVNEVTKATKSKVKY